MAIKMTNNAASTLAGNVSSGATSFTVVSGSTFPSLSSGDHTYVTIGTEVIKVTAISSANFTCIATGAAHSAGDTVELRVTAELLNDFSTDEESLPKSGGAMTGAITTNSTFDGRDVAADGVLATNALAKSGGTLTGDLILNDNVKLEVGSASGGDLQIYHDGSNSYISDQGTGNLKILASVLEINSPDDGEAIASFTDDGSVELRHNNVKKFETTAAGVDVTGNVTAGVSGANANNYAVTLLAGTTGLSRFVAGDGSDSGYLDYNHNGDKWSIKTAGAERLEINNAGIDVTGNVVVSGTVDGIDIATRDAILTSTTTTAGAALPKTGGTMTGNLNITKASASAILTSTGSGNDASVLFATPSNSRGMYLDDSDSNKLKFYGGHGKGTAGKEITFDNDGNVGIGVTAPAGKMHIYEGDAGAVTPSAQADTLVVENSGEGGITIMTPDASSARIRFTSPSTESGDEGGADIFYRQNINKMTLGTTVSGGVLILRSGANNQTMTLDASGNVGIGTENPYGKFDLYTGGATNYNGNSAIRSGVDFGSESGTHTIAYPDYCEGDIVSGMILIHAKSDGQGSASKAGTLLLMFVKTHGEALSIETIADFDQKISSFSASTSGNNIVITTDSDCAICWQSYFGR